MKTFLDYVLENYPIDEKNKEKILDAVRNKYLSPVNIQKEVDRLAHYILGENDEQIAEAISSNRNTLYSWRSKRNLPSINPIRGYSRLSEKEHAKRMRYYNLHLSDGEIADKVGTTKQAIQLWRHRNGLKVNERDYEYFLRKYPKRAKLYNMGHMDKEIGFFCGVSTSVVATWRKRAGLMANGLKKKQKHEKTYEEIETTMAASRAHNG